MNATSAWTLFVISALVSLGASAVLIVRLERVAARFGLREAGLGLVAALAADGPEVTAAVTGLLRGQRAVGTGVVLGSNAFNLAALLGLGALAARRIPLRRDVVVFEGAVAVAIALISLLAVTGLLHPGPALALAAAVFVPYLVVASRDPTKLGAGRPPAALARRLSRAVANEEAELAGAIEHRPGRSIDFTLAVVALAVVVGSSVVLEHATSSLGQHYRIPGILVGGVVLAAVTSLPNVVAAVYLARRARGSAVLSEALNSNSFNVLFGLLVPAAFVGLGGYRGSGVLVAAWYGALTVLGLVLAYLGRGLGRVAGGAMIAGYLGLVATLALR